MSEADNQLEIGATQAGGTPLAGSKPKLESIARAATDAVGRMAALAAAAGGLASMNQANGPQQSASTIAADKSASLKPANGAAPLPALGMLASAAANALTNTAANAGKGVAGLAQQAASNDPLKAVVQQQLQQAMKQWLPKAALPALTAAGMASMPPVVAVVGLPLLQVLAKKYLKGRSLQEVLRGPKVGLAASILILCCFGGMMFMGRKDSPEAGDEAPPRWESADAPHDSPPLAADLPTEIPSGDAPAFDGPQVELAVRPTDTAAAGRSREATVSEPGVARLQQTIVPSVPEEETQDEHARPSLY